MRGSSMKYISEERLEDILSGWSDGGLSDQLRKACQELSVENTHQWQTIESAPKDREILVYAPSYQDLRPLISVCKWHDSAGFCIDELRQPSHYCELPEPPK